MEKGEKSWTTVLHTIEQRERECGMALAEVEQPAVKITAEIDARRAEIARLGREITALMAKLDATRQGMAAHLHDPLSRAVDVYSQARVLLQPVNEGDVSCTLVPIGCGHAIEPFLARSARDSADDTFEGCDVLDGRDQAIVSDALEAFKQGGGKIVKAVLATNLATLSSCPIDRDSPWSYAMIDWDARDADGNALPGLYFIYREDKLFDHAIKEAPRDEDELGGGDDECRRESKVPAWAVYHPRC